MCVVSLGIQGWPITGQRFMARLVMIRVYGMYPNLLMYPGVYGVLYSTAASTAILVHVHAVIF